MTSERTNRIAATPLLNKSRDPTPVIEIQSKQISRKEKVRGFNGSKGNVHGIVLAFLTVRGEIFTVAVLVRVFLCSQEKHVL